MGATEVVAAGVTVDVLDDVDGLEELRDTSCAASAMGAAVVVAVDVIVDVPDDVDGLEELLDTSSATVDAGVKDPGLEELLDTSSATVDVGVKASVRYAAVTTVVAEAKAILRVRTHAMIMRVHKWLPNTFTKTVCHPVAAQSIAALTMHPCASKLRALQGKVTVAPASAILLALQRPGLRDRDISVGPGPPTWTCQHSA
eukprot:CAMPEP_0115325180 /NCGR_PEP_ID=MMETSP0270-20121206/82876_1 /TAXON_ID=71861 /ORGANISM="Scrippsiella trochoidea, Strain CCMP3099" /LENGTH=199 /DNA_ID=CAMNT_0002745351 /DNA_START=482 /DNA_END=1080 /DNA_ORIENTATION=+